MQCVQCGPGTYSTQSCTTEDTPGECLRRCAAVPEGNIQWRAEQTEYVHCPRQGLDCYNSSRLSVRPGFYLPNETWPDPRLTSVTVDYDGATQVRLLYPPIACPFRTCQGGVNFSDLCIPGSMGVLCGVCEPGWFRQGHNCTLCPEGATSVAVTASMGSVLALCAVALLLCYLRSSAKGPARTVDEQREAVTAKLREQSSQDTAPACAKPATLVRGCLSWCKQTSRRLVPESWARQTMTTLKILIGYLQMLSVFYQMRSIRWPPLFSGMLHFFDKLFSKYIRITALLDEALMPFSCVYHDVNAYDWLGMTFVTPFACSAFLVVMAICAVLSKSCNGSASLCTRIRSLRPALSHLHLWLGLVLYPSVSRVLLSHFLCTPVAELSYLSSDTSLLCYTPAWWRWAAVAAAGFLLYAIGFPACAFLLTWRYHRTNPAKRAGLGRCISLLLSSYTDSCWWFEAADLLRKLLLTCFVLNVRPNTRTQIWFGLVVSTAAAFMVMRAEPYRDRLCDLLQKAATFQILFTYITATVFFQSESDSTITSDETDYSEEYSILLLLANSVVYLLLLGSLAQGLRTAISAPLAHWTVGHRAVLANAPVGTYHAFVSHQWAKGQDQAKTIKSMLTTLVPSLSIFLDIDDLHSIDELEYYVDRTDVLVVFLTGSNAGSGLECSDYFCSTNCVREFRRAVETGKQIVLVQETDASHGHISFGAHRDACPDDLRSAFDELPVVPWYRVKAFQNVSLRLILQQLLLRPGSCNGNMEEDGMLIRDVVSTHRPNLTETPEGSFHLYASPHNTGSAEVASLLHDEASKSSRQPLMVTHTPEERTQAARFLVYLNAETHTNGDASARLHDELDAALTEGMPLVLVHEQRRGRGDVPFSFFLSVQNGQRVTPQRLLGRPATSAAPARPGLYKDVAIPLYEGEHMATSLRLVLLLDGLRQPTSRSSARRPHPRASRGADRRIFAMLSRISRVRSRASVDAFLATDDDLVREVEYKGELPPTDAERSDRVVAASSKV